MCLFSTVNFFVQGSKKGDIDDVERYPFYITFVQNDQGLLMFDLKEEFPNVLDLSSGCYGHIPIPLLKQEEQPRNNHTAPKDRDINFNYVGYLKTLPEV